MAEKTSGMRSILSTPWIYNVAQRSIGHDTLAPGAGEQAMSDRARESSCSTSAAEPPPSSST